MISQSNEDKEVLSTPEKVKTFLDQEGIKFDPFTDNAQHLLALARRRQHVKRKLDELKQNNPVTRAMGVDFADNVSDVITKISAMKANMQSKAWINFKFIVDDWSDNMVVLRHSSDRAVCAGTVRDGKCLKCKEITFGEYVFSFKATLLDWVKTAAASMYSAQKDLARSSLVGKHHRR